ncbi:hypothetical protein G6F24_014319 [Rhizopus arrhizus]|nr:hypothetical protein G6F24_014319 [Rhizopus arrhizus]
MATSRPRSRSATPPSEAELVAVAAEEAAADANGEQAGEGATRRRRGRRGGRRRRRGGAENAAGSDVLGDDQDDGDDGDDADGAEPNVDSAAGIAPAATAQPVRSQPEFDFDDEVEPAAADAAKPVRAAAAVAAAPVAVVSSAVVEAAAPVVAEHARCHRRCDPGAAGGRYGSGDGNVAGGGRGCSGRRSRSGG